MEEPLHKLSIPGSIRYVPDEERGVGRPGVAGHAGLLLGPGTVHSTTQAAESSNEERTRCVSTLPALLLT